ncbi:glutamate 5-kinase [Sphingomonas ginkgonis]|uniref:Glutamate 5-kinase n=1 Tax=Sphingomonas ginkgonis TaxID=2315330 RepID=A0A3R9WNB9_9SPHN|nr:glutamate 5-kinase [Sphingomonas ginkgonis]RST29534.1 glutamate 5-kinase [Sphingomonas ginkgonis]
MPEVQQKDAPAAALIAAARRITVKVGSSLLVAADGQGMRAEWLATLAADLAALRADGKELAVVSSGAVALGRGHLGLRRSPRLELKQAAAAAGQPLLMAHWQRALDPHGIPAAQLLLTLDDTESRRRWLNARATMEVLLGAGALPIVNENDSVAREELRYGDNDRLSARVAQLMRSDLLILLSDVDGVYSADPGKDPTAEHLPHIPDITPAIEALAGEASVTGVGSGGMRTKIAAARIARGFGCATIVASGLDAHPLAALGDNRARSTVIAAAGSPARAYKQWIAGTLVPAGSLTIDPGAAAALLAGKSLLPAGIRAVAGGFERGSCLKVLTVEGRELARGISAYSAAEVGAIRGIASGEIAARIGYAGPDEVIHRDDLVLM